MALLEKYAEGRWVRAVLWPGAPSYVDGSPSNGSRPRRGQREQLGTGQDRRRPEMLLARSKSGFAIEREPDDQGILFHHRRVRSQDGQFLLPGQHEHRFTFGRDDPVRHEGAQTVGPRARARSSPIRSKDGAGNRGSLRIAPVRQSAPVPFEEERQATEGPNVPPRSCAGPSRAAPRYDGSSPMS